MQSSARLTCRQLSAAWGRSHEFDRSLPPLQAASFGGSVDKVWMNLSRSTQVNTMQAGVSWCFATQETEEEVKIMLLLLHVCIRIHKVKCTIERYLSCRTFLRTAMSKSVRDGANKFYHPRTGAEVVRPHSICCFISSPKQEGREFEKQAKSPISERGPTLKNPSRWPQSGGALHCLAC